MTRTTGPAVIGLAVAWLAAGPAAAGLVFREGETIEGNRPGGEARQASQIRQVVAEGENCKVVLEESSDPLVPAGTYVLASTLDAFLVDPAGQTIAPLDPTAMMPAGAAPGEPPAPARILAVTLETLFDDAGTPILGLPTRHLVYRLRYQEGDGPPDAGVRWEERHEVWITPWTPGEALPAAWQKLRLAEDSGLGVERVEIRDALEQIYQRGIVLRQLIERRATGGGAPAAGQVALERVSREVTSFSRQDLPADTFEQPAGYARTEFLAPAPGDAAERGGPRDTEAQISPATERQIKGE